MLPRPTESQSQPVLQQTYATTTGFRSETVVGGDVGGSGADGAAAPGQSGFSADVGGLPSNYQGAFTAAGPDPGPSGQAALANPQVPGPSSMMPNPLLNCLAALITNIIQTKKAQSCCPPPNCPVPFIIRKVKPACQKKKRCAPPRTPICEPSSCNNNNNGCFHTKIRTLHPPISCSPKPCCCCNQQSSNNNQYCCVGPQRQEIASTNPLENHIAPILLVQGGRCQTIQIAERGCKCSSNKRGKRRSSSSTSGRKRRRRGSKGSKGSSSRTSASSSRSGRSNESESSDED